MRAFKLESSSMNLQSITVLQICLISFMKVFRWQSNHDRQLKEDCLVPICAVVKPSYCMEAPIPLTHAWGLLHG